MRYSLLLPLLFACSEYNVDSIEKTNAGTEDSGLDPDGIGTPEPNAEPGEEPEPEAPIDEGAPPTAICSVSPNPVNPPFEASTFDGSGSVDSEGGALTYYWQLVDIPEGSAITGFTSSEASSPVISNFIPDVAGEYLAQLTVTNEAGLTDTCDALLEAVPAQNLWVELYWTNASDDMDLHLIAPGSDWSSSLTSDQDCYYGNCVYSGLDWGQYGYAGDDPSLDLDDIPGTGPENINVYDPQTAGNYTVVVHDYPGSVYEPANDITVNIYLDGGLVWSVTRSISGEDSYVPIAQINWASKTVSPM